MILNAIVIKSDGSGNLTLLDTNPIFRNSSNKNVIYFYSPFSVANSIKIGFTLNNGVDTTTYPAFSSSATVDSLILPADQEPDYNIREFTMPSAITNQVAQKGATDTIMGFVESELQSSDDYLEPIVISDGVDVDGDLDTAFPSPAIGNFANVWNSSNNTFYSYLVMSVTPTVWANQSKLLNQIFTGTTGTIVLAINKAIATNDTDVDVTVTQLILEELAEQRQIIETLTSGGMSKSIYDTDDNGIVDNAEGVKNETNDAYITVSKTGAGTPNRIESKSKDVFMEATVDDVALSDLALDPDFIDLYNADAGNGDTQITMQDGEVSIKAPVGIRLYDEAGTDYATIDFTNGDFRVIHNGISKEYAKNLFVGIKSRTIIGEGVVIQYDGAVGGGSDKIWAKIADKAEINVAPYLIIGVTTTTLTANEEQDINFYGAINEIDTTSYDGNSGTSADEGAIIYYDSVNGNGGMTLTKPEAPNVQVKIAVISAYHATSGQIKVRPSFGHFLGDAHDVYFNGHTFIGDEIMKYDISNNRWHLDNLSNYSFPKTGWDLDVMTYVSIAFVNATRTFTLAKTGAVVDYWQENVKHTLDTDKTVVIDDIEGQWFLYLNGDTLIASQTVWDLRADNRPPVSVVNWDATNKVATAVAYELHSWRMSGVDHFDSHFGLKTLYISGLGLSDSGSDTLNLTAGNVADEDILVSIVDDDTPTAYWEQPLTPLQSYKYYRSGANGDLRRADDSTSPFYVVGNKVQLNPFSGGVWGLVDMTINKYGAGWVIVTSDITNPVKLFLGQEEADSLNDAIENNTITNLDLGTIPFEEILVAYRVIVKQINTAPYYEITQIDNMIVNPVTGETVDLVNSHGTLLGLADDDHTQYYNTARLNAWKVSDVDPDLLTKVDKDLSSDVTYPPQTAAGVTDEDKAHLYLFDDDEAIAGDKPKKMSLTEIYAGAAIAPGAFVSSADYKANGLGAYKSAMLTYFTLTLDTLGKFKTAIKTQVTDQILYIKMPTISSNQNDLQISTDDGTTYYDVLVNGGNIYAELVSDKLLKLQFDGSNFIIDLQSLSQQLTFDSSVNSTYGTVAPINGSPQLNKFYGLSLNQQELNGDVTTSFTSVDDDWSIFTETDGTWTKVAASTYDATKKTYDLISGNKYYYKVKLLSTSVGDLKDLISVRYSDASLDNYGAVTVGETEITIVFTATATLKANIILREGNTGLVNRDYQELIPITNTPLSTHTAPQINAIIPTYFEDYTYIVNPELWSRGLQLFNEVDYTTVDYAYKIRVNPSSNVAWSVSTQYKLYDINENEISTGTALTVATTSETAYIAFVGTISSPSTFMLNEGTTAEDWQAYNSPQDNFKLTANLLSVGSIRDEAYEDNGVWWKKAYVGRDYNDVVKSATSWTPLYNLTNTITFVKNLETELGYKRPPNTTTPANIILLTDVTFNTSAILNISTDDIEEIAISNSSGSLFIKILKSRLTGVLTADFETYLQANDVLFTFELATQTTTEIEKDGSLIQESNTTLVQLNNFATEYDVTFALDSTAQRELDTSKLIYLQGEVDGLEDDVETNVTAIGLNTTHKASDGTDHANVVLNDTHRGSNGTDHANVVLNDTHRGSDGKNHSDVVLNNTHRGSDGKNHSDVVANTANILKRVSFVNLISSPILIDDATTRPSSNITLSETLANFDAIKLEFYTTSNQTVRIYVECEIVQNAKQVAINFSSPFVSDIATQQLNYTFYLYRDSATTLTAYYAKLLILTLATPAYVVSAMSSLYINRIIGIKY